VPWNWQPSRIFDRCQPDHLHGRNAVTESRALRSRVNRIDIRGKKHEAPIAALLLLVPIASLALAQNETSPIRREQKTAQSKASPLRATTFCNPLNLDCTYKITESDKDISYRSGGDYYMFVTRAMGYWYSKDLTEWHFIHPQRWYFQGSNAPAAQNYRDQLLYVTADPSGTMSLLYTDDPQKGDWQAVPALLRNLQDPDFYG
jgi:hypothetical protein